jgi:hypothetical protein
MTVLRLTLRSADALAGLPARGYVQGTVPVAAPCRDCVFSIRVHLRWLLGVLMPGWPRSVEHFRERWAGDRWGNRREDCVLWPCWPP